MTHINSYYQGLIQNLLGASNGTFVCFMQFFYQYCQSRGKEIFLCFEKIYQNELKNCEILSEILIEIANESKFCSSSRKYLSASNVNYSQDFEVMFKSDVELLEISISEIKSVILKIENENVKEKLKKILASKKQSLRLLKENYFKIKMTK